VDLTEQFV